MPVSQGDVIRTGPSARVLIRFGDDMELTLGADSSVTIESYLYDPEARVTSMADRDDRCSRPWLAAAALLVCGGLFMVLPRTLDQAPWIQNVQPLWGGLLVAAAISMVILRPVPMTQYPLRMTLFSVFVTGVIYAGIFRTAAPASGR